MTEERSVESIIRAKNREIRSERERIQALEITNTIISAYLAILVERAAGEVRISKKAVSEALGSFSTSARSEGEDYIISVERTASANGEQTTAEEAVSADDEKTTPVEKTVSAGEESE